MKYKNYIEKVLKEYEEHIKKGESFFMDASTLLDIYEFYVKEEREFDAEQVLRFAEKLHPNEEEVRIARAYYLKGKGLWSKALKIAQAVSNQSHRDVQLLYAEYETAGGEPEKAEARVSRMFPELMKENDYDAYLDLAEVFMDYGYLHRAISYLEKIPEEYEFSDRRSELLGDAWFQLGDYSKSVAAFHQIVDKDPYDSIIWILLADIHQKFGRYEECMTAANYALAIDPNNARAANLMIFSGFTLGRREESYEWCKQYSERFPDDYSIPMYEAEQLLQDARPQKAIAVFQESLRRCSFSNSDRQRIIHGLAFALCQEERTEEVEELMLTQLIQGTGLAEIYFQTASLFLECKARDKAVEQFAKAIALPSIQEGELFNILKILIQEDLYSEAYEIWKNIADRTYSEQGAPIPAYCALAFFKMNKGEELLRSTEKAINTGPEFLFQIFGPIYETTDPAVISKRIFIEASLMNEEFDEEK